MRILKAASLAVVVVITLVGSSWADSAITPSAFQADLQIVQKSIANNLHLYQTTPGAASLFAAGQIAGLQGIFLSSLGNSKAAQLDFQTAISDFNRVLSMLHQPALPPSYSAPDAGSLALFGCSGIALFGALRRKFAKP
jgi:hypothetical protein